MRDISEFSDLELRRILAQHMDGDNGNACAVCSRTKRELARRRPQPDNRPASKLSNGPVMP